MPYYHCNDGLYYYEFWTGGIFRCVSAEEYNGYAYDAMGTCAYIPPAVDHSQYGLSVNSH